MKLNISFFNANPNTIWNALARELGREPTNSEAADKVRKIMREATIDLAGQGMLKHQRRA